MHEELLFYVCCLGWYFIGIPFYLPARPSRTHTSTQPRALSGPRAPAPAPRCECPPVSPVDGTGHYIGDRLATAAGTAALSELNWATAAVLIAWYAATPFRLRDGPGVGHRVGRRPLAAPPGHRGRRLRADVRWCPPATNVAVSHWRCLPNPNPPTARGPFCDLPPIRHPAFIPPERQAGQLLARRRSKLHPPPHPPHPRAPSGSRDR